MNKQFFAAGTMALDSATAATASTAEAIEPFFRRCFKNLNILSASQLKADPAASVDSQLVDEKDWRPDSHQSPLYDLAASNPYVIAASVFSAKNR